MKRLLNYVPLHLVVFLILGICFQFYTRYWTLSIKKTILLLGFLILFILIIKHKKLRTLFVLILFFLIGISSINIDDDRNYHSFYKPYLNQESIIILQIHTILKPNTYYQKYKAKIIQVDDKKTTGFLLLNIEKQKHSGLLKIDDRLLIKPVFKEISPSLNPYQFNYQSYLAKQHIYQQIFTEDHQFIKLKPAITLFGKAAKVRTKIEKSLKKYPFKKEELALIKALLLGQRQSLSKELVTNYQKAGAIHILAISGLHVGIVLMTLTFLLKPLEYIKYGRFIKTLIIVLILWCFAFITGLSASVVRAVCMFTIVAIGMAFKRKTYTEFSLISSFFLLLLIKPLFLFDVGFQLSYLAVFGIVWMQPKFSLIWQPKLKTTVFFWNLLTVSLAAQISVLPLSIYYFQQFPGLFLISNLIIVPFLSILLIGGFLIIITSVLSMLPSFIAQFYGDIISYMNAFVSWISQQEAFLFKELSISFRILLSWYLMIFIGFRLFVQKSSKKIIYFLGSILLTQSLLLFEKAQQKTKEEILVFHKTKASIIAKRIGVTLFLQQKTVKNNVIEPYKIKEGITEIKMTDFNNYLYFNNNHFLLVDSLGIYHFPKMNSPFVILQYSPKINLTRLIKTLNPTQIIADGSNYKSYIKRWKTTCLKYKIPFHYTGEKGAFVFRN